MVFYKNRDLKACVFDLDGTIIDSLSYYVKCFNDCMKKNGLPTIEKKFLFDCLSAGMALEAIIEKFLKNKDKRFTINFAQTIKNNFLEIDFNIPLLPGVKKIIKFLNNHNVKIGIATGRMSSLQYEKNRLKHIGLNKYISAVATGEEVKNQKPSPDLLLLCCERLNIHPSQTVIVGDTVHDITAARNIGAVSIAVTTGVDTYERLNLKNPDVIINHLKELIDIFEKEDVEITGTVISGAKKASFFTKLEWVKKQSLKKLGFLPFSGTLNVKISVKDSKMVNKLTQNTSLELIPDNKNYCSAKVIPVYVSGIKSALIIPNEKVNIHEKKNIIEILSPVKLREKLGLTDGDIVNIRI